MSTETRRQTRNRSWPSEQRGPISSKLERSALEIKVVAQRTASQESEILVGLANAILAETDRVAGLERTAQVQPRPRDHQ
ncbi:MAG: hypothetical protein AB7E47_02955 [Desulfovibrionaceae bacterium]